MALRKRGDFFNLLQKEGGSLRKGVVPTLEETMVINEICINNSVTYPPIFGETDFSRGFERRVMPPYGPGQSHGGDQAAKLPEAPRI